MRFLIFSYFMMSLSLVEAKPAYIVFANGMRNTLQEAQFSLQQLRIGIEADRKFQSERLRKSLIMPWKPEDSALAYNFKNELIEELREVYRQKKTEKSRSFWKWYYDDKESSEEFKKIVMEEMMMCEYGHRIGETLFDQRELYEDLLRKDYRIVTVSHSQGNLFSNSIYEALQDDEFPILTPIQLISVASPASYVAGGGSYVTLTSDGVINDLLPVMLNEEHFQPMKPNTTNADPKPGTFDHGFVEFYLGGDVAGRKIKNHIYDIFF